MQNAVFGIMIMGEQEISMNGFFFSKNKCRKPCVEKQIFTL
jgi:hypothetical protein